MKRNLIVAGMAIALIAGTAMLGADVATAQSSGGSGMMGGNSPGSMMGGNGHGPGMMGGNGPGSMMGGNGHGPGMMGGNGPGSMMGGNRHGPGMMGGNGPGSMMGGNRHGPGMMGGNGPGWMHARGSDSNFGPQNCPGFQSGRMGMGPFSQQGKLNLSTDDVKKRFEGWLTWQGNPRLKVGEVKEKDVETIEADIVTKDNSLVQRFAVDRHTGAYRQVED